MSLAHRTVRSIAGWVVLLGLSACAATPPRDCESSTECTAGTCRDGRCVALLDASSMDAASLDAGRRDSGPARDSGPPHDSEPCISAETPELTCNRLDDDCNGLIDDIDVGDDGFCDCLQIGVLGSPGSLASTSFQAWLEARGTSVVRFGEDSAVLTATMLAMFDVIVVDRLLRTYEPSEAALLLAFVEAGGGLIVLTGHDGGNDLPRANSLLAPFEVAYVPGLYDQPVTEWVAHPVSTGVTSVTFRGGYRVNLTGAGTPVASLAGETVAVALERGEGRVFVWGDEWIEYDSEWSAMPMITQLWINLVTWAGPQDRCLVLI